MKKYISIIIALVAVAGTSCKKDYLNLQTNPNNPIATTPQLGLTGALKVTADITNGGGYTMYTNWVGYLSWSTGYQANVALESYQITTQSYDLFTPIYLNISNYNAVYNSTTEPNFQGIAKIMMVFDFEALVDNYNNVPYTDALKGTAVLNPKYDKGSDIYDDLLKQIDAAIVLIQKAQSSTTALNPGVSDIMYGGNMTNWLKFANTIKLRLALRQSNITSKTAALKAAVQATASIGYLDGTNGAVVNPGYLNSDAYNGQQSPLWRNYGYTQNGGAQANNAQYQANSYGADKLTTNGDTRGYQVYLPDPASGKIVSTAFGETTPPSGTVSKVGNGVLKSATMNATIMSSAEALFLEAEGAKSGYFTGDPAAFFKAGVEASFVDDGLTVADADAYLDPAVNPGNAYPAGGTDAQQEQAIIDEKWKALAIYGGFEAFNELRRTGYPNDIPLSIYPGANPPNNVTLIPLPAIEYKTNPANAAAQGTVNVFTSKVFWAK